MSSDNIIEGYLECSGIIKKITSLNDINEFVSRFGKNLKEISEDELNSLTSYDPLKGAPESIIDDCGMRYTLMSPKVLLKSDVVNSYKIQDGTIAIADKAFMIKSHDSLKSIFMPDSVIVIGKDCFRNNVELQHVVLSNSLLKIDDFAFYWCKKLKEISLPNSLMYIGKSAFGSSALGSVVIPVSVKDIGSYAFADCCNLEEVRFAGSPEQIGSGVFDNCNTLQRIIVPQATKQYFVKELFPIDEKIVVEECV